MSLGTDSEKYVSDIRASDPLHFNLVSEKLMLDKRPLILIWTRPTFKAYIYLISDLNHPKSDINDYSFKFVPVPINGHGPGNGHGHSQINIIYR
jgi:hypothetical protein